MPEHLLILGASARAAAFSALRDGWQPVCGDLFADVDLRRVCSATLVDRYPDGLEKLAQEAPPGPWLYTGALENYPELVDRIAAARPLYGNPGATLRRVRDPLLVAEMLRQAGLPAIECRATAESVPVDGYWLCKRRRSAAGLHVQRWHGGQIDANAAYYFQRYVEGVSCAAVYVSAAGEARLLGVTEQLLRGEFQYAGSLGPLPLDSRALTGFTQLGSVLAAEFGLVGVWGVDAVLNDDGVWPVEVNPRYTASMEVLERASGASIVGCHVAACRDGDLPRLPFPPATRWHGKTIVYAAQDLVVTPALSEGHDRLNQGVTWPAVADLPAAGAQIRGGHPLCTAFAEADDRQRLVAVLSNRARDLGG